MGLSQFFMLIELALKAMKLWESFLDWQEENKIAIRHDRAVEREKAIQAGIDAKTEDEIWEAQTRVVENLPQP
jgi:hypothetical protein